VFSAPEILRLIVNWIPAKVDQSLAAEQEEY
jgi:hypothetical protein